MPAPQQGNLDLQDPISGATEQINPDRTTNIKISDGVTATQQATVAQFHNIDNQALPVTSYGLLAGGVAQIVNILGNLDRQREAGQDGVSSVGIAAAINAFAQYFQTSSSAGTISIGAASATITPAAMFGVQVGAVLMLDIAPNAEAVLVTALPSASTATVIPQNAVSGVPSFKFAHSGAYQISGFVYNQERDAAGENSGAKGGGTAVATAYEETSGGPPLANGTPSLLRYDREVATLGKNASNAGAGFAITSTTAGDTILTPTTAANFKTLTAGQWIQLSGSGTVEYVRVSDAYTIATAPATIPLTSPVVNTGQTVATWDTFGATGPGTNPVLLTGEGLEGVLLNDSTKPGFGRMWQGDPNGNARVSLQAQGTVVTSSAAVAANTANSATLAAVAAKTNYVTGFSVTTQGGASAAAGAVTLAGILGGTLTFEVGAAAGNPVSFVHTFPHPIPASAVNTALVLTVPALGATTGAAACTLYGYVQ